MSDKIRGTDNPEAPALEQSAPKRLTCWYCGSDDLTKGLSLGLTGEPGALGVKFEATGKVLGMCVLGYEPLRVTICNECGTVVRLSVKDTEHKWA